jgi:hypothetical protein
VDERPATISSPPRGAVWAWIAAVAVVGVVAFLVGRELAADPEPDLVAPDTLVELHLENGRVFLGTYVTEASGMLVLSDPAELTGLGSSAGLNVSALALEPTAFEGTVLVQRSQVSLLGAVRAGSTLADAYAEAVSGEEAVPSSSPGS